jgi:hypothetical protein
MWEASVFAAIALAAAAFMLRFLIALLREGSPSVCYWVVPGRQGEGEILKAANRNERVPSLVRVTIGPSMNCTEGWQSSEWS